MKYTVKGDIMDKDKSIYIYRKEFNHKRYDTVSVQIPKHERIKERIAQAAKQKHITQARYIKQAIETQLQLDGITAESLPDRAEAEQVKHD